MKYRKATFDDLEILWNKNIDSHKNDSRWKDWKEQYINYNKNEMAVTFVAVLDESDEPVGEITILFSPMCKAVLDKTCLCDGKNIANLNAFRIEKNFEGQGHISTLLKMAERFAKEKGFKELSIGVEACESRNLAIYLHWGYNKFVMSEIDKEENDALVLYYKKTI